MKKTNILFVLLLLITSIHAYAQEVRMIGDLKPLKGQQNIQTIFIYDHMSVGKYPNEKEYVAQKKAELNKREPGRGDIWVEKWITDRKERFEPKFCELFDKYAEINTTEDHANYTLIFITTMTEPGWNVGVMRAYAYIHAEVFIIETSNPENIIAKFKILNSPGRDTLGLDFDTGFRIQEAYAKAGKSLGRYIKRKI